LILHHDVTQDSNDTQQLEPMAKAAKEQLQQSELSVTADAGYSNGKQFQACEEAGITAYVPPNRAVNPRSKEKELFERMEQRMQAHPEMMVSRRSIVEHPFGNLKHWLLGNGRFLLRQLEGATAEMALAVNAYNLKRAINVLGVRRMMALMG